VLNQGKGSEQAPRVCERGSRRTEVSCSLATDGVVFESGGPLERCQNIVLSELRIIAQNLRVGGASSKPFQNIQDGNPEVADAGLAGPKAGSNINSVEQAFHRSNSKNSKHYRTSDANCAPRVCGPYEGLA